MGIEQLIDAYKGNPGPLEAKVKQDQQGLKPGELPKDFEEALALQEIQELQQGAQNQQAMQAGGAQPSIVEKLKQMLAANQRQQAQPPQGQPPQFQPPQGQQPQGQPPMPQGQMGQPPQPPQPPQGQPPVMAAHGGSIDQLMSNLGRHYAGGGIVAFSEGDEVRDPDEDKRSAFEKFFYSNTTPAEQRRMAMLQAIASQREEPVQQDVAPRDSLTPQQIESFVKSAQAEQPSEEQQPRLTPQQMEAAVKEGPLRQVTQRELAESYVRKRAAQRAEDAAAPKQSYGSMLENFLYSNITPAEKKRRESLQTAADERMRERNKPIDGFTQQSNRALLNAADADLRSAGIPAALPDASKKKEITGTSPDDIRTAPPRVNTGRADRAPMPGGLADLANIPSVGVGTDYQRRMLAENQKFDPEAYKQKFLKEVGRRDLSIYDEMAEELKARKERLKNPEPGFDSLMEYLGQIAQSGGGRSWMEAGAKGAAGVKALQKERQTQQDALVDKILDLGSKKKEAEYNERLGLFNLTKTEKDRIDKDSREIAGKLGMSEDKEIELRQQMAIETMKIKAQKEINSMPGAEQRFFNQMASSWLAKPENKGKSMFDAYTAFRIAGAPSAANKGAITRDQAADNVRKNIEFGAPMRTQYMNEATQALNKAGIASPSATQIMDYLVEREMGKANSPETSSSGKVVDFSSLPK
jgi:hypothetical protein